MLRDKGQQISQFSGAVLSAPVETEINKIIGFVDTYLPTFPNYYQQIKDSDRENRVSDFLVHHFQMCKVEESGGYYPFDFRKNPTQATSGKETDIGVFPLVRNKKPQPIIEFEAKRFSDTSNNKEYVCGERGGIERFKRGHHSSHLKTCGMFAYVQKPDSDSWITKVNDWIKGLSTSNSDTTIEWTNTKESLKHLATLSKVEKLSSSHSRLHTGDDIALIHYFIDLN